LVAATFASSDHWLDYFVHLVLQKRI